MLIGTKGYGIVGAVDDGDDVNDEVDDDIEYVY